jgi:hypothetical protein
LLASFEVGRLLLQLLGKPGTLQRQRQSWDEGLDDRLFSSPWRSATSVRADRQRSDRNSGRDQRNDVGGDRGGRSGIVSLSFDYFYRGPFPSL